MKVTTVDQNGEKVGRSKWVRIKEPDYYPVNGLSQIESYVDRVLTSNKRFTSLMITASENKGGLHLVRDEEGISIHLHFRSPKDGEAELKARAYFDSLGARIWHDYLAGGGEMRMLSWVVATDARLVTGICRETLRQFSGVRDEDALQFTIEGKR